MPSTSTSRDINDNKKSPENRGPEKKSTGSHRRKKGKRLLRSKNLHVLGAVLSLLQAGAAALFIYLLNGTGMIPWKYVMTAFAVLAGMVLLVVLLVGIRKRRTRLAAVFISAVMIIVQLIDLTEEEKNTLLEVIRRKTGKEVEIKTYSTAVEAVRALLNKEVDSAVYREAYAPVLEEVMDSYSSGVRIVDTYEIRTELEYESVEPGEPFHLLISGIDVKGDISQASRSDVNIIVTINPKTKKILMTTTPRDYYVEIPGISNGQRDKLTHAGIYGEDASIRTLEQIYGIDITYYVRVNFTTLIDIVDAIDGVDVWSDYEFDCYTDHKVHIDKGMNHLNGRQALAFCRERFSFPDGDNQRGKDQEAVLKAIIEKVMSPALIVNASALIDSMRGSFQTDMPETKIAELISQQLSEGTDWIILRQATESGPSGMENTYSGGKLSVTWPDEYSIKKNSARMKIILDERPEN